MTEREAKLYVAMMEKPEWKSGELYRLTGVPRVQTHQTLELMVSRQYCSKRSEGRFNYYRAIPPEQLNEMLVRRWEEEMTFKKELAGTALVTLGDVFKEATKGDRSLDFIEIVQSPHRIHQRFMDLLSNTKEEQFGFNKSPYSFESQPSPTKKRDEQTHANEENLSRGVKSRSIIMYEPEVWEFLRRDIEKGNAENLEEMRIVEHLPLKMYVFDRKVTMFGVNSVPNIDKNVMSQIIIHDVPFASMCADIFEMYWKQGLPYKEWIKKHP